MIQYTVDTYEGIEEMIAQIDRKHNEYTNSSVERIRYLMNTDRSAKGRIIDLLKASGDPKLMEEMQKNLNVFTVKYAGQKSMYDRVKRTKKQEKRYQKLEKPKDSPQVFSGFLEDVRNQYSNKKIDAYMEKCMEGRDRITTEDIQILDSEDFILYLLCTIRGKERTAPFTIDFEEGNTKRQGYSVPRAVFKRKVRKQS
jgi:hypothetical protein